MDTIISRSPEETRALGERWGRAMQPGWVFALMGDLGTGKTELVRGIAAACGVRRVHSPTFAIIHQYSGLRFPLYHLDLYRLSGPEEVLRAGLEEYLFPRDGVAVVEWADRWFGEGEESAVESMDEGSVLRRVWIETLSERERGIRYEDIGA